jgi:hypothetical protein
MIDSNYSIYSTQASVNFLFIITRLFCRCDRPVAPTSIFGHRMFNKHPMSFCKAIANYFSRIRPNKRFSDIGCLADIRCLTIMNSIWVTKSVLRL